jgi:hypothetical protein
MIGWLMQLWRWWRERHQRRRERALSALRAYRARIAARFNRDGDLSALPDLARERRALRRIYRALR